jgi:hypothetical protein
MESDTKLPLSHKSRRGSEARQKQRRITFRVTAEEYAALERAAEAGGVTLGSFIRDCTLKAPQTKSRRRPRADMAALSKLHGELNRIGGNVNQITRRVNFGDTPAGEELRGALSGLKETMAAIRGAMGFEA